MSEYKKGLHDGLPVGLGYLSVSFAFGVTAVQMGVPAWLAVAISMTNLTSAGQLAGLSVIASSGGMMEMALTQLVINIRYALMSVSLSQKLDQRVKGRQRLFIDFGNTDELFAIASGRQTAVSAPYFYGLMTLPYLCWALGTLLGVVADEILPTSVLSALGMAIYGMFAAIVLPAAKQSRMIAAVAILAAALSCLFHWTPGLSNLSSGFVLILCAVVAAAVGAILHPVNVPESEAK